MLPELYSIGSFTIYSYGLMTAIAILAAVVLGDWQSKKAGLAEDGFIFGMGMACVVGGYASAKILFWLTILPELIENPVILLDFSNGFVAFGGLIGGVLTAYFYCGIKGVDFWKIFDLMMPYVALAQGIGRIGCFLAGCCYGRPTESIFGISFCNSPYVPSDEKLFPIQLVFCALDILNFLFLYLLWKKAHFKKGSVGAAYLISYSIGRFCLEYFRGDTERGSVGQLSTSQFIAFFTLAAGCILWLLRQRTAEDGASLLPEEPGEGKK